MRRFLGVAVASATAALSAPAQDTKPAAPPANPAPVVVPAPVISPALPAAPPLVLADCPSPATAALCNPCGPCATGHRSWITAEWLFWAVHGDPLPPLITASPVGTPRTAAGVLGTRGAVVVGGGTRANDDFRSGLRVTAGRWLNECETLGIEGRFFFLGDSRQRFAAGSPGSPIFSRPFVSTSGAQASELVAFPGVLAGGVVVDSYNRFVGGDAVLRHNLCCSCAGRVDLLLGYRYLGLTDDVSVTETLTAIEPAGTTPFGTRIVVRDRFRAENDFHGGVIGLAAERRYGDWVIDGRASVGLGNTHQQVLIAGSTTVTTPGGTTVVNTGGLLAQRTNIGRYSNDVFSVVPEAGLRLGYQATDGLQLFVGYDGLLWTRVARAGDQIDLTVNSTQIPPGTLVGAARPAFTGKDTTVWVQGVSVGVKYRY